MSVVVTPNPVNSLTTSARQPMSEATVSVSPIASKATAEDDVVMVETEPTNVAAPSKDKSSETPEDLLNALFEMKNPANWNAITRLRSRHLPASFFLLAKTPKNVSEGFKEMDRKLAEEAKKRSSSPPAIEVHHSIAISSKKSDGFSTPSPDQRLKRSRAAMMTGSTAGGESCRGKKSRLSVVSDTMQRPEGLKKATEKLKSWTHSETTSSAAVPFMPSSARYGRQAHTTSPVSTPSPEIYSHAPQVLTTAVAPQPQSQIQYVSAPQPAPLVGGQWVLTPADPIPTMTQYMQGTAPTTATVVPMYQQNQAVFGQPVFVQAAASPVRTSSPQPHVTAYQHPVVQNLQQLQLQQPVRYHRESSPLHALCMASEQVRTTVRC